MKSQKLVGLILLLFLVNSQLSAQVSEGGTPPSFAWSNRAVASQKASLVVSAGFDIQKQIAADNQETEGMVAVPLKMGKVLPVNLNMENAGEWMDLPDGTRIWQLTVKLPDALASMLYYDHFRIPEGGKLFIYSADKRQILGAYTHKTNASQRLFATELVRGDAFTLEYVSPAANKQAIYTKADLPHIQITGIVYVYNYVAVYKPENKLRLAGFGNSGSCEVNVNCEEGDLWQDQKKGVVKTISSIGNTTYLCSGTLINNAAQDLTPYYLSAYHCFADQTEAELAQTAFYFHYETETCENGEEPTDYKTLIGAELLVMNPIEGESDGALLLLKDRIPDDYNVFFNGWDNRNVAPTSGVSIHHPAGDVKKISTYSVAPASSTWTGGNLGAYDAHWDVRFVETPNGWGVTEPGSSGSPLFNQNGLVVGTLTGGTATCSYPYGTSQYGKLGYHWDKSPNANRHMKTYLDPHDTGIDILAGTYTANATPSALFRASATAIFALQSITYTNQSLGAVSYHWIFEGGTPAVASERNPEPVAYTQPGTYSVTLIINEGTPSEDSYSMTVTVGIKGGTAVTPVADFSFLKFFFEENFDGDLFPPAGWTMERKGESQQQWFNHNVVNANFSVIDPENVTSAVIYYDDMYLVDSWLVSPAWQIPSGANLEFYAGYSGNWLAAGVLNLFVSTDNGVNWTQKWTNGPDDIPGLQWGWHQVSLDLSEYNGQSLRFAWQYYGLGGDMAGVDGVKVIAPLPSNTPVILYVGDAIYPVDRSTGPPVLYDWQFEKGTPVSSRQEKPVVRYWTAGTHDISLQVKNTAGEDTKIFTDAVTVLALELEIGYEVQGGYTRYPDYGRFIPVGSTLQYKDKTVNYPMSWNWTFEGGTPAASTEQNPAVTYAGEGSYGFDFTTANAIGEKSLSVSDFIKVGGEEKIWNLNPGETGEDTPSDWLGYKTGTNSFYQTHFAERFEAPLTSAAITAVDIAFRVDSKTSGTLEVSVLNDEGGYPGEVIATVNLPVSAVQSSGYTTVRFPNPVPVNGPFYISAGNFYNSPFQIAIKHEERYEQWKSGFKHTAYVYDVFRAASNLGHGPGWFTLAEYALNTYASLNMVPALLYGSYMNVTGESNYKRKSTDPTVETIEVHANIAWQAAVSVDWIEITNGSGTGDGSFSFTVKENAGQARRGILSVGTGAFQRLFLVEQAGPPASNLTAAVTDTPPGNVELNWQAPLSIQTKRVSLGWSNGEMFDVIGKEAGGTYEVAIRFAPSDLLEYTNAAIKEVEVYIENLPANKKLTLKFHQGGQVIYSQEIAVSDTESFVSIPLTGNLYIDSSQDLYVGYEFTQTPWVYVAGVDAGPAVPGKGILVSDDGGNTFYSLTDYNVNYNWIIGLWIETGSRLDYLVYRDDQYLESTSGLTYLDQPQTAGNYCYKVIARYDESLPTLDSNSACIEYTPQVGLDRIVDGGIKLYPNPVSDRLTIRSDDPVTALVVTNPFGQVVFTDKPAEAFAYEKQIDVSAWAQGIYLVRVVTAQEDKVYKVMKK
jgi:PKD repeat protein